MTATLDISSNFDAFSDRLKELKVSYPDLDTSDLGVTSVLEVGILFVANIATYSSFEEGMESLAISVSRQVSEDSDEYGDYYHATYAMYDEWLELHITILSSSLPLMTELTSNDVSIVMDGTVELFMNISEETIAEPILYPENYRNGGDLIDVTSDLSIFMVEFDEYLNKHSLETTLNVPKKLKDIIFAMVVEYIIENNTVDFNSRKAMSSLEDIAIFFSNIMFPFSMHKPHDHYHMFFKTHVDLLERTRASLNRRLKEEHSFTGWTMLANRCYVRVERK